MTPQRFEPLELLAALEQHRVAYVVVGKLAGVIHGTGGVTDVLEICPQMKEPNLTRLRRALDALDARPTTIAERADEPDALADVYDSPAGKIEIVADPPGTRGGWVDLRRRATREPLGGGIRAPITAIEDLVRIAAAAGGDANAAEADLLRRVADMTSRRGIGR